MQIPLHNMSPGNKFKDVYRLFSESTRTKSTLRIQRASRARLIRAAWEGNVKIRLEIIEEEQGFLNSNFSPSDICSWLAHNVGTVSHHWFVEEKTAVKVTCRKFQSTRGAQGFHSIWTWTGFMRSYDQDNYCIRAGMIGDQNLYWLTSQRVK